MSRKSSLLALAAIASLGAFALSSTDALAFHGGIYGGGGMHVGSGGMHIGGGPHYGGYHASPAFRRIVRVPPRWWWPHHHWWHWGWHRHYWYTPVVATGVATYAAGPTWNRCTCLTKEYTPEGAVVFKDVCTNEMAMNPPESGPASSDMTPPQQQGYLQPQTRAQ